MHTPLCACVSCDISQYNYFVMCRTCTRYVYFVQCSTLACNTQAIAHACVHVCVCGMCACVLVSCVLFFLCSCVLCSCVNFATCQLKDVGPPTTGPRPDAIPINIKMRKNVPFFSLGLHSDRPPDFCPSGNISSTYQNICGIVCLWQTRIW